VVNSFRPVRCRASVPKVTAADIDREFEPATPATPDGRVVPAARRLVLVAGNPRHPDAAAVASTSAEAWEAAMLRISGAVLLLTRVAVPVRHRGAGCLRPIAMRGTTRIGPVVQLRG
jgi:hypothetical protein